MTPEASAAIPLFHLKSTTGATFGRVRGKGGSINLTKKAAHFCVLKITPTTPAALAPTMCSQFLKTASNGFGLARSTKASTFLTEKPAPFLISK